MVAALLWSLLACTSTSAPGGGEGPGADPSAQADLRDAFRDPLVTDGPAGVVGKPVFSETDILFIDIELSEASYLALEAEPTTYVDGAVTVGEHTWSRVGVRLKGTASFQPIDAKASFKIKFEDYSDERFYGLDRLTLQNNYWDPTMMTQVLAYRFFASAGLPAPRTGYAWVTLNGEDKGLYTILESMDSQFVDREWPGSEGNLYERTPGCDFNSDGTCFELQEAGDGEPDPDAALASAVAAVETGTLDALRVAFDWEDLLGFLAAERVVNHPDSYSYGLNNFFAYHDPVEDQVSLVPWGADSTFHNGYREVLAGEPIGWLGRFCESDDACRAELEAAILQSAELMTSSDLLGYAEQTRERIGDYVEADPLAVYDAETVASSTEALLTWIEERPVEINGYMVLWE